MTANTRFPVAVHIMTALAYDRRSWLSSPVLAASVGTNPVVIRRLLGPLHKAGLVKSHPGKLGGMQLARRAESITLLDIFNAVEGGSPFALPEKPRNKACAVSCAMNGLLASVLADTDRALSRSLEKVRLSDLIKEIVEARTSSR